jgi:hypothetical protein
LRPGCFEGGGPDPADDGTPAKTVPGLPRAAIPGIGPAKTATLASFGIESAADINRAAILSISGFSEAEADKLEAWREVHIKRFVYNPAPLPADAQAAAKVENEFAARASELAKRISGGQAELAQLTTAVRQRLSTEVCERDRHATGAACRGLAPHRDCNPTFAADRISKHATVTSIARIGAEIDFSGAKHRVGTKLPAMRRTDETAHGRHAGRSFWGCTRYPVCRGTRN